MRDIQPKDVTRRLKVRPKSVLLRVSNRIVRSVFSCRFCIRSRRLLIIVQGTGKRR